MISLPTILRYWPAATMPFFSALEAPTQDPGSTMVLPLIVMYLAYSISMPFLPDLRTKLFDTTPLVSVKEPSEAAMMSLPESWLTLYSSNVQTLSLTMKLVTSASNVLTMMASRMLPLIRLLHITSPTNEAPCAWALIP